MNKEEAQERLAQLRWAVDSLPDDAKIINFAGNGSNDEPSLHVDRETVNADLAEVRSNRWDLETVERYRHVGNVRVFGLVQSFVPEGV
jgi:hypothetical protein